MFRCVNILFFSLINETAATLYTIRQCAFVFISLIHAMHMFQPKAQYVREAGLNRSSERFKGVKRIEW